jgi:hypothetical protein
MLASPYVASAQQAPDVVARTESPRVSADQQQTPQNVPQKAQDVQDAAERVVRRFGIGVDAGIGLDPQLIDFGAHGTFGPIFRDSIAFRPGIEFGVGEVTTMFAINLDVLYTVPGATRQARWSPYIGAGPSFGLSHRGFEATGDNANERFDFGDTSFDAGFNFIAGVRNRNGLFLEMKATAYGVTNVKLMAGYNF